MNDTLYRNSKDNYISVEKFGNRTEFTVSLGGKQQSAGMEWAQDKVNITYDDGSVEEGTWDGEWIYGEDGMPLALYTDEVFADFDGDHFYIGKGALSNALCRIDQNETEIRGSVLILLMGGILYLIGVLTYLFPNESYFFMSRWAFQKAELSDAGISAQKIGAAISIIAGIVITVDIFII